ncbi:hypothetical protein KIPB_009489 [Kipferlia bialata]|uniref:Uncharacterized protein n=1 Tax=Kipferlia bialata TaxID=797122 RepID=A0A9K3GKT0_9EUKA|nr:hypothetical protein KIPB_009489 [Kipferlia bialata]|eukprot:g9489.t1
MGGCLAGVFYSSYTCEYNDSPSFYGAYAGMCKLNSAFTFWLSAILSLSPSLSLSLQLNSAFTFWLCAFGLALLMALPTLYWAFRFFMKAKTGVPVKRPSLVSTVTCAGVWVTASVTLMTQLVPLSFGAECDPSTIVYWTCSFGDLSDVSPMAGAMYAGISGANGTIFYISVSLAITMYIFNIIASRCADSTMKFFENQGSQVDVDSFVHRIRMTAPYLGM